MSARNALFAAVVLVASSAVAAPTEPSESKAMLGLDLKAQGAWKPTWDPDAKVAKWENPSSMSSIVIRIVSDKLDNIEDLKAAAPMMMQLGQAITKVAEAPKTTPKGWYAVVEGEGTKDFIYVQKYGSKTVVCSASEKSSMGAGVPQAAALKACNSIKVK